MCIEAAHNLMNVFGILWNPYDKLAGNAIVDSFEYAWKCLVEMGQAPI